MTHNRHHLLSISVIVISPLPKRSTYKAFYKQGTPSNRVLERFPLPRLSEARVVKPASFSLEARIDNRLALEQRVPEMGAIERIHPQRPSGPFLGQHFVKATLGTTLARHRSKPRVYIGCMKSGLVLTQKGVRYHEPEYWKFGEEGNKYFRHATGQLYAISKDFATYVSINQ